MLSSQFSVLALVSIIKTWNPSCYREDYKEEHTANQAFVHTERNKLSYCLVDYLLASVVMHIWRPFQMPSSVATESFLRTNTLTNWPMKTGFGCSPWPNIHLNFILASAHNARIMKGGGGGAWINGRRAPQMSSTLMSKEELDFNCAHFKSTLRKYIRFKHVSSSRGKLLMNDKTKKFAINKFSQEDKNNFNRIL